MKVATCQMPDIQNNPGEAIRNIIDQAKAAALQDAQLVVFPECYMQGYVANDEAIARSRALDVSSPAFAAILSPLAQCKPTLIFGLIEIEDNILYNTAAVVRHGKLIGLYRKTHPNEKFFQAGTEYPIFSVGSMKFGINICHDANFKEAAIRIADQDAQIILYPLNNMLRTETAKHWKNKHLDNLITRAKDTKAWVVSADVVGEREGRIAYGCTAIVSPEGSVVARVPENSTGIVIEEIAPHS